MQEHPSNTILRGDTRTADTQFASLIPEPQENIYNYIQLEEKLVVPESFEGRKVWAKYLSIVVNQKTCGSCWAFAAVSALTDRFNLHSLGKLKVQLSPVSIVLCDTHGASNPEPLKNLEAAVQLFETVQKLYGCNGNLLSEAWRMLYTLGTNDTTCMPLDILKHQSPSSCIKLMGPAGDMCADYQFNYFNNIEYGTPAKFYAATHVYAIPGTPVDKGSELNIRKDIYKFGPVSTAMEVYQDLYTFDAASGAVYESNYKGGRLSGHAVVIDGWGEQDGVKYWWVRNSWGTEWGMDGYFKMLRGTNHCKIEENVVVGLPDIAASSYLLDQKIAVENIPKDVKNKFLMHSYQNIAGGIDPVNGYSRRILSYLKYNHELDLTDVKIPAPDYETFVAGEITAAAAAAAAAESSVLPERNRIPSVFGALGALGVLALGLSVWSVRTSRRRR